jgi:hypothetical protein
MVVVGTKIVEETTMLDKKGEDNKKWSTIDKEAECLFPKRI